MFVGIDDTDSVDGMCTTYLAARLCLKLGVKETPCLIRLNPNIPYKTRGNGAVAFKTEKRHKKEILSFVKKNSMLDDPKTNPGVVFLGDESRSPMLQEFYRRAVSEHVTIEEAETAASSARAEFHKFKNGRGIIGALAAIGFTGDRTYEIIAYRDRANWGQPARKIDLESVRRMDRELYPKVFDNIGADGKRILITPRGHDPIFCGIRGTSEDAVNAAWDMVKPLEAIELVQVFATNQATDAHLRRKGIGELKPYDCAIVTGRVISKPGTVAGGHTIFRLEDDTGAIDCAAYKKSGSFRKIVANLEVGDKVSAYGGLGKYHKTLNLEKIEVLSLSIRETVEIPSCCGKNMTSTGRDGGYKCKKCGKRISHKEVKVSHGFGAISPGTYDVPPGSRRHLSRPVFLR
ncbi:MAG: tRNA(Ile)(2)-agmatinylcytidine synthase [Candidatus Altiarchaeota archaeon]